MTPQDINNQFMLRVGTILHGTYRIDSYLSSGGFGNTYKATNIEFDEKYAIKEFFMKGVTERDETSCLVSVSNANNYQQFEEQREKFKKEARRLRKLKNEHIVKVHDLFEENGTAYYVMDYIDGESLAEKMKKTGRPLPEEEVRTILLQILGALKEVHQNEIWHLDLKPGNIMLDKSGNAYLIDFGASKQIRANGGMTTSTALCYTPGYAPIEQIGQMYDRFGPWTDIYALGATVYNLLTNKKPPMAIDIEEVGIDSFSFPVYVSDGIRKLIVWMMQPQRKSRPQDVDEILTSLDTYKKTEKNLIENVQHAPKLESEPQMISEGDETMLISESELTEKTEISSTKNEEVYTKLCITKQNRNSISFENEHFLLKRPLKVGDFIYEDGTYSDNKRDVAKKLIGVLYSYYGGAHGQILSSTKPDEDLSINGKKLKWHEASITEWVEVIQNLGHCKVYFESWQYRFYSESIQSILSNYQINECKYRTMANANQLSYVVDLDQSYMRPLEYQETSYPFIYISDF